MQNPALTGVKIRVGELAWAALSRIRIWEKADEWQIRDSKSPIEVRTTQVVEERSGLADQAGKGS